MTLRFLITFALVSLLGSSVYCQEDTWKGEFFTFKPELLPESKWRYTYTLHLESNTVLHTADINYEYFLYFKYNNTFEQFLNGEMSKGRWNLKGNELEYSFRQVSLFKIVQLTNDVLVVEFVQPFSKGHYQYHFIQVDEGEVPFIKPANELPLVRVDLEGQKKEKRELTTRKKQRRLARLARKKKKDPDPKEEYISVELVGGGYYGGIDPVIKDYIQIKSDGRLIKEFQSERSGLIVTKKYITRHELEMFADYIESQGFFSLNREYDCTSALCNNRKKKSPRPIPLRLAITRGNKKKVVTINIWGQDNYRIKYVKYPESVDHIIEAIQRMAHRSDDDLTRR